MRNILVIAEREFKHYFISPIAYAVAIAILLLLGILFYVPILAMSTQPQAAAPGIQIILSPLITLLLFFVPGITMRTLSEEQKTGTLELLLTAPVRDWEVVVGKWLGAFGFVVLLLLVTLFYPIVLNQIVQPGIDQGLMVAGYLGMLLLSAAITAIGVMASSLFGNQIAALFITWFILLGLTLVSYPAQATSGAASELIRYFDLSEHLYTTFMYGIVNLKDIAYFLSITALSLFVGSVVVESRRWR